MYDLPGMAKAGMELGAKFLQWALVRIGLKNTPEMKQRDQAKKSVGRNDQIEKHVATENENATRNDLG